MMKNTMLMMMLGMMMMMAEMIAGGNEPNPPNWPSGVYVFDPSTPGYTQSIIDQAFSVNGGHDPVFNGQWSTNRYAFLFKPGVHNVRVNVGYYTSVIGLGSSPKDTSLQHIVCENGDFDYSGGALSNFWRSVENVYNKPTLIWNNEATPTMLWAVSQASPLRRIYVEGNLDLWEYNYGCCAGYASGGYLSNSVVTGQISSGSQQQWVTRNTQMGSWLGGVWNMVFVGNSGNVPGSQCPPTTTVQTTPVIAEKPYIVIDGNGKYYLMVPPVEYNKQGPSDFSKNQDTPVDFSNVFVAQPSDNVSLINSKIASGLHVVFGPGIYNLTGTIVVNVPNIVLLGIGFPTFISNNGAPCFRIGNVDGVRVGGMIVESGDLYGQSLFQWGSSGYKGNPANPGFLYDFFARVGGDNDQRVSQVSADTMLVINSGQVVVDDTWLWRADHSVAGNVYNGDNPCKVALQVNGANVTMYGLAAEHALTDLVQWNGEYGRVYFYQSEFPYDVSSSYQANGYVSYRVLPSVQHHAAYGVGAYSFFRDYQVFASSGFACGTSTDVRFNSAFTVFLSGNGGIAHVINNLGGAVQSGSLLSYQCNYNS